jgi:four helix bundle protein
MKKIKFGFEDLEVWQKPVKFVEDIITLTEDLNTNRKHYRLIENLEASAVSIPVNISEGKGRYSKKEFVRFLYIARGSLYETVTFLEIFKNKKWIEVSDYNRLTSEAKEIVKMIVGLINSIKK